LIGKKPPTKIFKILKTFMGMGEWATSDRNPLREMASWVVPRLL